MALAKTTSASTKAEGTQIRVRVRGKPITPRSYTSPWSRVATKGSTSQNLVTPVTEAIATEGVSIQRVTLEMMANTGLSGTVVWQETDTPDDVMSWSQGGTVGSAVSSNGITFPGKPVSVTPTKRYMRYGLQSVNVSGAENESASQVSRPIPTRAHATEASCCTAAPYMLACSLEALPWMLRL